MIDVPEIEDDASGRTELLVLGRVIGSNYGWDGGEESQYSFYEFEPLESLSISIPATPCLLVDFHDGTVRGMDNDGSEQWCNDLVIVLANVPKKEG